jgi:hypothetical protein
VKIELPTGALTVTVHARPAPAAVQFGEFAATLAITGAATPVTAIETDAVDGDKNCGRRRDADDDDATTGGNVIATVPRSNACVAAPPDDAPPPEHEASKRAPSVTPTPVREIAKRT